MNAPRFARLRGCGIVHAMGQTRLRLLINRATIADPGMDEPDRARVLRKRKAARDTLGRLVLRLLKQIDRPWRKQRWGPKTISDLTSEVSRRFFESLSSFRGASIRELRAWLRTSLDNHVKNAIREARSRTPANGKLVQLSCAEHRDLPGHDVAGGSGPARRLDLRDLVDGLNDLDRQLIWLRYGEDRPIAEVAALLALSERTVHRRINAVLKQLAAQLQE